MLHRTWKEIGRCYTILCQDCTHCATLYQGCYVVQLYGVCPPPPLSTSGLSDHGYLLNTYYWTCARFRQDLHTSHGSTLVSRNHGKGAKAQGVIRSLFHYRTIYDACTLPPSVHIQEYLQLLVIEWTPTTGLYHCQTQPWPTHEPWSSSNRQKAQGSTRSWWKVVYFSLCFWVLNRISSHMCYSQYLSVLLFTDGSFTHMNIASFVGLVRFCASLPPYWNCLF